MDENSVIQFHDSNMSFPIDIRKTSIHKWPVPNIDLNKGFNCWMALVVEVEMVSEHLFRTAWLLQMGTAPIWTKKTKENTQK